MKNMLRRKVSGCCCQAIILLCLFFPAGTYANESCEIKPEEVKSQLQLIQQDLFKVITLREYKHSIEKRYDHVETLLTRIDKCIVDEADNELLEMKKILLALRSNARSLAFTKFDNWVSVKEGEARLFDKTPVVSNGTSENTNIAN